MTHHVLSMQNGFPWMQNSTFQVNYTKGINFFSEELLLFCRSFPCHIPLSYGCVTLFGFVFGYVFSFP